jgi:hypothetical protein
LTPLERTREEFYETEESYVAGLAIIVKVRVPVRLVHSLAHLLAEQLTVRVTILHGQVYLAGVTGILSPNDLDTIFSNVATIYAIHKNLKQEISHIKDKERAQSTQPQSPILSACGCNFVHNSPQVLMLSCVSRVQPASRLVTHSRGSSRFSRCTRW